VKACPADLVLTLCHWETDRQTDKTSTQSCHLILQGMPNNRDSELLAKSAIPKKPQAGLTMRSAFFCDVTQRILVLGYRRLRTSVVPKRRVTANILCITSQKSADLTSAATKTLKSSRTQDYSWFQNLAALWMLYFLFCAIHRRLNVLCRRFGTPCLFNLHRPFKQE